MAGTAGRAVRVSLPSVPAAPGKGLKLFHRERNAFLFQGEALLRGNAQKFILG